MASVRDWLVELRCAEWKTASQKRHKGLPVPFRGPDDDGEYERPATALTTAAILWQLFIKAGVERYISSFRLKA